MNSTSVSNPVSVRLYIIISMIILRAQQGSFSQSLSHIVAIYRVEAMGWCPGVVLAAYVSLLSALPLGVLGCLVQLGYVYSIGIICCLK